MTAKQPTSNDELELFPDERILDADAMEQFRELRDDAIMLGIDRRLVELMLNGATANLVESAEAITDLVEEYGMSLAQVATITGLHKSCLRQIVPVLQLPPTLQSAIADGEIARGVALRLTRMTKQEQALAADQFVEVEQLTNADLDALRQAQRKHAAAGLGALFSPTDPTDEAAQACALLVKTFADRLSPEALTDLFTQALHAEG